MDVVLDTNIAVSAAISRSGNPAEVIKQWQDDAFRWVISPPLLTELERTLRSDRTRKFIFWNATEIEDFLTIIRRRASMVWPTKEITRIPADPADNRVLEAAVEGHVDYVVTGDWHLLELKEHEGTEIVTPRRFLAILAEASSP